MNKQTFEVAFSILNCILPQLKSNPRANDLSTKFRAFELFSKAWSKCSYTRRSDELPDGSVLVEK